MKKTVFWLNILFGFITSLIVAVLLLFGTKFFVGGSIGFGENKWLYMTITMPITVGLGVLGSYFYDYQNLSNKQMWKITFNWDFSSIRIYKGITSEKCRFTTVSTSCDQTPLWELLRE